MTWFNILYIRSDKLPIWDLTWRKFGQALTLGTQIRCWNLTTLPLVQSWNRYMIQRYFALFCRELECNFFIHYFGCYEFVATKLCFNNISNVSITVIFIHDFLVLSKFCHKRLPDIWILLYHIIFSWPRKPHSFSRKRCERVLSKNVLIVGHKKLMFEMTYSKMLLIADHQPLTTARW